MAGGLLPAGAGMERRRRGPDGAAGGPGLCGGARGSGGRWRRGRPAADRGAVPGGCSRIYGGGG